MQLKESIYFHSPIFIQNLLTTLQGRRLFHERYGPAYQQRLQELKQKLGRPNDIRAEQLHRLNDFLSFAKRIVRIIRNCFPLLR